MRIQDKIERIDYSKCEDFFEARGKKYSESNPYAVTMYQDENPVLVNKRNRAETEKLIPMLSLDEKSRILDVACGIGRWADAIEKNVDSYVGLDFSESLIKLAKKRNRRNNFKFVVSEAVKIRETLVSLQEHDFNVVLMVGIFMYLNDEDVYSVADQTERSLEKKSRICIREPVGIEHRLTLKDFYSEELKDNYNAIYRTREEFKLFLESSFMDRGFRITNEGFLFDNKELNNRRETSQYYYILERD